MNCPDCGYKMAEIDLDCPRCEKLRARAQQSDVQSSDAQNPNAQMVKTTAQEPASQIIIVPESQAVKTPLPASSEEIVYLQNADVTVTSTRVVIGGKTYALSNVTSVSMLVLPKDIVSAQVFGCLGGTFGLVLFGIGALLSFDGGQIFGGVIVVAAILIALQLASQQRVKYIVRLGSAQGRLMC